jgi:hypothetical protein
LSFFYNFDCITAVPGPTVAHRITEALNGSAKTAATAAEVLEAAHQTDTTASQAQRETGNYRKGRIEILGMPVAVENPQGSIRSGTASNGRKWHTVMRSHYGYIVGTNAVDGDPLDIFIGDDPECELIHVINQNKADGTFDELKVIAGCHNEAEARKLYLSNYQKGWTGLGSVVQMTLAQFKKWKASGHKGPVA